MTLKCELKEQPAQPILSVRTMTSVHELPQELGRIYGAIATYLAEIGEQPSGAPFAAYYNMDMDNLDVEIGFPVARPLPVNHRPWWATHDRVKWASCVRPDVGHWNECGDQLRYSL